MQYSTDIDTSFLILSSNSTPLKTDNFTKHTQNIKSVDFLLSRIAGKIIEKKDTIFNDIYISNYTNNTSSFMVATSDHNFAFLFKFGFQIGREHKWDIIFYKYLSDNNVNKNDIRIDEYLSTHSKINITISTTTDKEDINFNKLYRVTNTYGVNFPQLSPEQLKLVNTEDKNVLIQGVAGSGKTNVCIEKLIWSASKNYSGRVLYTTFSRGLLDDTKLKVNQFKNTIKIFIEQLENNKVVFLDNNKKSAIENYLGIFIFASDTDMINKLKQIVSFIDTHIDYYLIEDLYKKYIDEKTFVNADYFHKTYLPNIKNHQLKSRLKNINSITNEVLYKEIFGLLFGYYVDNSSNMIGLDEYTQMREDFTKEECNVIYQVAQDYKEYLQTNNYVDNNLASREIIDNIKKIPRYSLVTIDEVQDFTQINIKMFSLITLKLFCAGDALQMINPAYFSFGYLKNLLFKKDIVDMIELTNNYRNALSIQKIINNLENINKQIFGTHNFVTNSLSIDTDSSAQTIYCCDKNIINEISKNKYDTFTIVVPTNSEKNNLHKVLKNQEILTISEIKGLERDVVILYNILSINKDKWLRLERLNINKKKADENSIYRYYFNTFYVGLTRAKQNVFIIENEKIPTFDSFFNSNFNCLDAKLTNKALSKIVGKIEYTQEEYIDRINQFINLEQYDNARFTIDKITDDIVKKSLLNKTDIFEKYVKFGKHKEAGIMLWEASQLGEARKQFELSNDQKLIELIDAIGGNNHALNYDIIKYYLDVSDSIEARKFILEILHKDINNRKSTQQKINQLLKNKRGNKK